MSKQWLHLHLLQNTNKVTSKDTQQLLEEVLEVVRFYSRSYNINEQQDAQEIFMWLINQIHNESCRNTAPKRRSIKSKDIKVLKFSFVDYY